MNSLMTKRVREKIAFALGITEEKVAEAVADKNDLHTTLTKHSKYNREQVKLRIRAAMYATKAELLKNLGGTSDKT